VTRSCAAVAGVRVLLLGALLVPLAGCPARRSPDRNGDGVIDDQDVSIVAACLGADFEMRPACFGSDMDGNGRVEADDVDLVIRESLASGFPALSASDPTPDAGEVPRTAWIRLDFGAKWKNRAAKTLSLDCGGAPQSFHFARLSANRLIVNPSAELPPGTQCSLAWVGPGGRQSLAFSTAAAGPPASVLYDRSDASLVSPFPDDYWLAPDAAKPTGQRVAIGAPARDALVNYLFGALTADTVALDGFSPLAMIAVELSEAPDLASLPLTPLQTLDPLATVGLFDLTPGNASYGERIPFQLHVRNDTLGNQPVAHSLVAFPSIPLTPGGRYAFVVTRRALVDATQPFEASEFLRAALAPATSGESTETAAVREVLAPVLEVLATAMPPLPPEDLALALRISIRSTSDLPRDLLAMKAQVLAEPAPQVTVTSVLRGDNGGLNVRGTFQAPNWRQGQFLARDASGAPRIASRTAVPFALALPAAAANGPVPVVMYQHGNPGSANDLILGTEYLRHEGFAIAGFSDPLSREFGDAGLQMTGIFSTLLRDRHVPDLWTQTYGEQFAFLRALETLATRDFMPVGALDGVRELDLSRPLSYLGISFGANHGQAFLAYAPEIRAAALVVGATRLSEMLFHQDTTDPLRIGGILRLVSSQVPGVRAPDVWVGLSIFQMLFDRQDPQNHAAWLHRDPIEVAGTKRKASLLVVAGIRDRFTPSNASHSLAWTAGPLPQLSPIQEAVPMLEPATGSVRANLGADTTGAFVQYACSPNYDGHFCAQEFSEPQQLAFFRSALEPGAPTIVASDRDADGDGLADVREAALHTDPQRADTDGDGLADGVEVQFNLNPLNPADAVTDLDGDGLSNAAEIARGTQLRWSDSDNDGVADGQEVASGTDPLRGDTDGGGRTDGQELNRDRTNPLDRLDDVPLVELPATFVDGLGFEWRISPEGRVDAQHHSIFSGDGFSLTVYADRFSLTGGSLDRFFSYEVPSEDGGRELRLGPLALGTLRVTRKIYVPVDAGFVRFLDIVENTGEEERSTGLRVMSDFSDSAPRIIATSSGDALLDPSDDFAAVDDGGPLWVPIAVHGFSGPGAALEPTSFFSSGNLRAGYLLVIPPRSRVAVMSFGLQSWSGADAIARIEPLLALGGGALSGLSSAERKAIVNFSCAPDADGDGVLDFDEDALGTDPHDPDSDGDALLDGFEVDQGFDPLQPGETHLDADADGANNALEQALGTDPRRADSDGDGLADGAEVAAGTDPLRRDSDKDSLGDAQEVSLGTDPLDANGDADGDGLSDVFEVQNLHSDPLLVDTDGDGLRDDFEFENGLYPTDPTDVLSDGDEDGLTVRQELALGTSFWDSDSDDDRLLDGDEVARGLDPLAPDTDRGGRDDWSELRIDRTDPLVAGDDLQAVSLPAQRVDGGGFAWVVDRDANVTGGPQAAVSWTPFSSASGWYVTALARSGDRDLLLQFHSFLIGVRKIHVPDDAAFIRILDIVEDEPDGPGTRLFFDQQVALGSGSATQIVATSSGDLLYRADDHFLVTDDADGSGSPAVVQVLSGPGAPEQLLYPWLTPDGASYGSFDLALPPGGRAILMTFLALADSRADAIAMADHLSELPPEALAGMSDDERAAVVNFVVPPAMP
jgi:hypothetical protein